MAITPSQLGDRFKDLIDTLTNGEMLTKAALLVQGAAQKRARVRTGNLRRSITFVVERDVARVGTAVEYALYQPEPFLELGAEDAQEDIQRMLKEYADAALSKVGN